MVSNIEHLNQIEVWLNELPDDIDLISERHDGESRFIKVRYRNTEIVWETGETFYCSALRGPAASSTGYRSIILGHPWENAKSRIDQFLDMPFLVGPKDAPDAGWQFLQVDCDTKRIQIRLPHWAGKDVRSALRAVGFEHSCPLNDYHLAPTSWTEAMVREVMKPWMVSGTRALDEFELVSRLEKTYAQSEVRANAEQIALF